MQFKVPWLIAVVLAAISASPALAAPTCPINYGQHADAKPNKLYLYFPAAQVDDPSIFPPHGFDPDSPWLPLKKFDSADLPAYTSPNGQPDPSRTVEALRDKIYDVVADTYCEFNVQVIQTTSPPPPLAPGERRVVVGIGADAFLRPGPDCDHKYTLGQANVRGGDTGDASGVDFARVWAGTFQACAGGIGGDLHGPRKSKLERWANAIASTGAHEAAHTYGLGHADGAVIPRNGEDQWDHHLMRGGFNVEQYAFSLRALSRHFSDFETSVLARNIGLAMDTMWTWHFVNLNAETGTKLRMEVLSTKPALVLSWGFAGETSPWGNPAVSGPMGTRVLNGTTYNVYQVEWSAGKAWQDGPPGQVPGSKAFQVGATFSSLEKADPAAVIVANVTLLDASDNPLPQRPGWMGFDAGTLDSASGNLNLRLFNLFDRPLIVRDVVVQDLPRVMSINSMVPTQPIDKPVRDVSDDPDREFTRWDGVGLRRPLQDQVEIRPGEEVKVAIASLGQPRHIYLRRTAQDCTGGSPTDVQCQPGLVEDLFPATTMYITATIVDPATVTTANPNGVETRLFYQVAGRRLPDIEAHRR